MKPVNGPSEHRHHHTTPRHAGDGSDTPPRAATVNYEFDALNEYAAATHTPPDSDVADIARPSRGRRKRHRVPHDTAELRAAGVAAPKRRGRRSRRSRYIAEADHPSDEITTEAAKPARRPVWKMLRRICYGLVGIMIIQGGVGALTAPQFSIHDVDFECGEILPAETVDAVRASLIGQNWIRMRAGQAERALKSTPQVRTVQVARSWTWPPKVAVAVEPRQPFARVGGGKEWWVVDSEGVPFRAADDRDKELYAVTGPLFKPELGKAIEPKQWQPVVEFATTLSRDEEKGQRWNLRRVYFDRSNFASLRLTGGQNDETLVQLGPDDWDQKLQKARWALADFAQTGKHAATLNLISSKVTWTPRVLPAEPAEGAGKTENSGTEPAKPVTEPASDEPATSNG